MYKGKKVIAVLPAYNASLTLEKTYNEMGLVETERDVRGTITRYVYTQGMLDEAADGANPLFAPGVAPARGVLTQIIVDDSDADGDGFSYTTTYKSFDELDEILETIFD